MLVILNLIQDLRCCLVVLIRLCCFDGIAEMLNQVQHDRTIIVHAKHKMSFTGGGTEWKSYPILLQSFVSLSPQSNISPPDPLPNGDSTRKQVLKATIVL
mgnify:FL=1